MNAPTLAETSIAAAADLPVSHQITSTALLIENGTPVPESLRLQTYSYSDGWSLIRTTGSAELDRRIQQAGWHFFYLASAIKATVFGFREQPAIGRAMKRLISIVAAGTYNCLQVEDVRTGHFLGFPFVSIVARPRHIQQSAVLMKRPRQISHGVRTCSYV